MRSEHPEFMGMTDEDMIEYIKAYDHHIGFGFTVSSQPLIIGGCFILFVGWLFFNAGSSWSVTQNKIVNVPQLAVINTILAASGGALLAPLLGLLSNTFGKRGMKYELTTLVGAILSGCVSVTAGCNNIETEHALFIGMIGGILYYLSVILFDKLKIDDPL